MDGLDKGIKLRNKSILDLYLDKDGLFNDYYFYITKSVNPSVDILKSIINRGNGTVITRMSNNNLKYYLEKENFFIVTTEDDLKNIPSIYHGPVYTTELILSSVMKQYINTSKHILENI